MRALLRQAGWRAAALALVMLASAFTEGIGLLLLVPLLGLVGVGEGAGAAHPIASVVGSVLTGVGVPLTLTSLVAIFVGLVALRAGLQWRAEVLLARLRAELVDHLRRSLFRALARADWAFLAGARRSDFLAVITVDVNRVGFLTYGFLRLGVVGVLAAAQVSVALSLSPTMASIALGTLVVLLVALSPTLKRAHALGDELSARNKEVVSAVTDSLAGLKVVKTFGAEAAHERAFDASLSEARARVVGFASSHTGARAALQVGGAAAVGAFVYVGAEVMSLGSATLLVLVFVLARLVPTASQAQQMAQIVANALPAHAQVQKLRERCEASRESPAPSGASVDPVERRIELSGVSFRYENATRPALDSVDLTIEARSTTAITGPSGAGKTTVADLVMGLLAPTEGQLAIDGEPLRDDQRVAWRRQLAYVPQEPFLFHATIRENLLWAVPGASDAELQRALEQAAADDFVARLPDGLDTVVGDRGSRLSGGERQRIALARALLRRPSVLVLDEATSAVDAENERKIHEAIDALHQQLTIVLIAHRLSTIRSADRIYVLEDGRVAESGSWSDLEQKRSGRLRRLAAT